MAVILARQTTQLSLMERKEDNAARGAAMALKTAVAPCAPMREEKQPRGFTPRPRERPAAALIGIYISFMCSAKHPKNSATHVASNILGVCFFALRKSSLTSPPQVCGTCRRWPTGREFLRARLKVPGGFSRSPQVVWSLKRNDRPRRQAGY